MASKANGNQSYKAQASELLSRTRDQATMPRVLAASAVAAGAGVFALLRNPERRERLKGMAHDYSERASGWWNEGRRQKAPSASEISLP